MPQLDKEQSAVVDAICKDIKNKSCVTLGGAAGVGKSEVVRVLCDRLPKFAVCTFMGKAANVLRKKGIADAATIHSLIYIPEVQKNGKVAFHLRPQLDDIRGFIIDEGSVINMELYDDLRSFGLPLIVVGDHHQLEPVGNNPNLMKYPDYRLEKIHRNAGEIAHFAEWVRLGKPPAEFPTEGKVHFVPAYQKKQLLETKVIVDVDQIICAFNVTRQEVNAKVRAMKGLTKTVEVGDRVMCLRNNKTAGLFNGMQCWVTKLHRGNAFDLDTDVGRFGKVAYHPKVFGMEKIPQDFDLEGVNPFEYAYCATCHKMQADEADDVMVIEQVCQHWDHLRWIYTAASRAKNQLVWIGAYQGKKPTADNDWF